MCDIKMRIKINKKIIFYFLIVITPIIDTVNGFFIKNFGATGLSLGTFYRFFLIVIFIYWLKYDKNKFLTFLLIAFIFLAIPCFKGLVNGNVFGYLTYGMKWIFPIIIYFVFEIVYKNDIKNAKIAILKILNHWVYVFPSLILLEFLFDIGYNTYYDAGFKGLFYSTNDIAVVLIILFAFSCCKFALNIKQIFIILINLISIIIVSTKSGIILAVFSMIYFLSIYFIKRKVVKIVGEGFLIICGFFFINNILASQIQNMLLRYRNMWQSAFSQGNSMIYSFINFATSGRISRISKYFNVPHNFFYTIIGWISPDNATVVEMDWIDLFFQYGALGFGCLFILYFLIFKKRQNKWDNSVYMFLLGIIYSNLGGHVISGAMSGTVFAIVCCYMRCNYSFSSEQKI